ncbi:MAG: hypothetical protein LQ340_001469 [Diploschistes diacapsis]|nr:MAG: hypothetical protein LQ340_001469 [Diploschistes diacapsis]
MRESPMASSGNAPRKILVAVDFGTTHSAIAWAQASKPDIQEVITLWPTLFSQGHEGQSSDKVPTELRYEGQDVKWGFQILESQQRHQFFKLELDESKYYKASNAVVGLVDHRELPPGYDITPERVISDFLEVLRKHAEQILRNKIPTSALTNIPVEYLMTVPAIWSDNAKAKTKAAAQRAGMGKVHMVAEPEAAAVFALHSLSPHNLKVSDTFMLVDAGGGTVDVITYEVDQLEPILNISEVTSGAGALCGSSFINRRFQETIKDKLSNDPHWDDEILEDISEKFERVIKRTFAGVGDEQFQVPVIGLEDDAEKGIRRGKLRVTGRDVEQCFEPIVEEVIALVTQQIKAAEKPVSTILLVGGFGQSQYLRSKIQASVANTSTTVMQSPHSWTAVVRGALMMGLASHSPSSPGSVRISARKARKHYGYKLHYPYNAAKHPSDRKWWSDFDKAHRVTMMKWFLHRNDVVEEQKPLRQAFYLHNELDVEGLEDCALDIYSCADDGAATAAAAGGAEADPDGSGEAQGSGASPPAYCDERVRKLATVRADLSGVPPEMIPRKRGKDGKWYLEVKLEVRITFLSAFTKYELWFQGTNYGEVHAEYV